MIKNACMSRRNLQKFLEETGSNFRELDVGKTYNCLDCKVFCMVLRQQTFREETQEKHVIIKKKILGTLVRSTRIYHTSPAKFFLQGQNLQNSHSTLLIISNNVCLKGLLNFILKCTSRFFSERGTFIQLPVKETSCSNARTLVKDEICYFYFLWQSLNLV